MKTLSFLSVLAVTVLLGTAYAAPVISPSDISEDALRNIATDRQKASMDNYEKARQNVEKQRDEDAKKAKEITDFNDNGLKKTIQKRRLNDMLPACEREPEVPREPGDYEIRY